MFKKKKKIEWIAAGEVPEYKLFTDEPKAKRTRRHKKYARESREAKELKKSMGKFDESLEQQIMKRQNERATNANSFFDQLMAKYGDVEDESDDSELYDISAKKKTGKKVAGKKSISTSATTKKPEHKILNGRVSKKRNTK